MHTRTRIRTSTSVILPAELSAPHLTVGDIGQILQPKQSAEEEAEAAAEEEERRRAEKADDALEGVTRVSLSLPTTVLLLPNCGFGVRAGAALSSNGVNGVTRTAPLASPRCNASCNSSSRA